VTGHRNDYKGVLIIEPRYKIRKLSVRTNLNSILHNITLYKKQPAGYITAGMHKEVVITGDSFIM